MTVSAQKPRDLSLDIARGVAVILMIQTHAFHGWVEPSLQARVGFRITRWLGAFPLPSFLLLAGMAVALTVQKAVSQGHAAGNVRRVLLHRGLGVVAWGYAVNVLWGVIDGARSLETFLRAEVLHAIGLSLCLVALLVGGAVDRVVSAPRLVARSVACSLLVLGLSPWLTRLTRDLHGPWRYAVALFSEVRGVTVMPVFPLAAWCSLGVMVGLWLASASDGAQRQRRLVVIGGSGLLSVVVGTYVTQLLTAHLDEPLSRASLALWPNAIEGAGRALCVVTLGAALSRVLPVPARQVLGGIGAASLPIYALHVPFCYGRLAGDLRRSLTLVQATPWVLLLIAACYAVVPLRAWMNARRRGVAVLRSSA